MPPFICRLKRPNNPFIRCISFDEQENWEALAQKIAELFSIPVNNVGVIFIINDAKVLVEQQQDLQSFYKLCKPGKLTGVVQDRQAPDSESAITSTWSGSELSDLAISNEPLTLFCWVLNMSNSPFSVDVRKSNTVDTLKKEIKKEKVYTFGAIDADALELWKLSSPISSAEIDTKLKDVESAQQILGCVKLNAMDELSVHFPSALRNHIHIIVESPLLLPQKPPVISSNISLRKRTVEGLYNAMMKERLIYVRGTSGSGKSTLLDLLHRHILHKDPNAFVRVTKSWPPQNFPQQNLDSYGWLEAIIPSFPARTSLAFLLMDDAHDSFGDSYLWRKFLKEIIYGPSCYRVVVFCRYGSISTPSEGTFGGTPADIRPEACMTLWPRKVNKRRKVNGLLLDWDEFNEVVLRFDKELAIDLDLSQKIFELTAGYVGAVCQLLGLILDKMKTYIPREGPLTLGTYYENFSNNYIMNNLAEAFARGLPESEELLLRPDLSRVLRRLLVSSRVTESSDQAAIQYCHRNGWIYPEDVLGPQSYTLVSPLHHAALSWRIPPMGNLPQFETAYTLSLAVLANFKPSQMKLPIHRVNGGFTDLLPEAQYQDEYLRSLFAVTCGNVRISPEFASAGAKVAGRIDFFIPGVKWGIEITREGNLLNNYASRFKADGAYNKFLKDSDITDYVLLDCGTTTPRTSHLDIPNLYHAVFNEKYTEVCVLNNKKNRIWGPTALQENHSDNAMLM